ncbi:MAG: PD-(D/E)XK nuclease family protein [Thermoanaerobaculia bacterium]
MPNAISILAAACRDHLLSEKIVVVPSLAIGHQIADAIAHSGTPWVNLRGETVRTLADAVAGFALAAEGVTVLSRAQALALIERACDRVLGESSYFAELADRPGLHRAIQKSIDDLRHAGITPGEMRTGDFEDARKAGDLARILGAYDEEMARAKYIDRFGVLQRATSMLEDGAPRPWPDDALWFVVDDVELTAAEERFLRASAGEWVTVGSHSGPGAPAISFKRAVGEENEIRGAIRAILGVNGTFDDAEIVYTARDPYLPLIYELAAEYEVPCTFAEGIASHFTRPGQACLAFLRWIGEGWHAVELREIVQPGLARILRKAGIGWGRDRYLPRIDALIAESAERLKTEENEGRRPGIERTIERAQTTRALVTNLLRITAEVAGGETMNMASAARAASRFVAEFAVVKNEVDAMAQAGLRRLFEELVAIEAPEGAHAPRRDEVSRRLAEAARALHVSASNPRPGFLHAAPIRAGGWSARSRMFIAGLDEQRHPGSGMQDPIILDSEREAIGIPVVGDRPQRMTEQFRRLLKRSSSREVTLSWSMLGLRERRERFASSTLLEVYRQVAGHHDATFEDVERDVAKEGFVDPQPLSASEWWLLRRFMDREANLRPAILAAYPALAAGAEAEAARDSDAITKWDGKIAAPPEVLDPRLNARVYSASQLEQMASCPYRYFLDRILGVKPLEEIEYEPDTWLEAMEFGNLLHEVLQTTMEELSTGKKKPALAFLPRMKAIAAAALVTKREQIPPPSEAAFERRETELMESCEIFLRDEETVSRDVTPRFFEKDFAFRLPLGGGRGVDLRGYIDRIDHDETNNEWHVWDYKSGSTYAFDRGGQLQCGTKIQHAIYARAVEQMVKGRVTKSGYFFPTAKGSGARLPRTCTDQELKKALNLLFDVIGSGYFPHAGADNCRFCDFHDVCGTAERAADRTAVKVGRNGADPGVAAWVGLQGVK